MKGAIIFLSMLLISLVLVDASSIFLSGYLEEGETTVYETEEGVYVISLLSVGDSNNKAVFRLNDEMSKAIRPKDSYVFEDGSEIVLRDLVINEAEDGNDEAYYYFYGTGKGVLDLRNISRYVLENKLCNFDTQCLNETKENCCYDCGCNEEEECVNNECVSTEKEEEGGKGVEEEAKKDKVEGELEIKKGGSEKKVAIAILVISLVLVLFVVWKVGKRKRSIF